MLAAWCVRKVGCALALATAGAMSGGCVQTKVERVGRYEIGGSPVVQPAPVTGVFGVRWREQDRERRGMVPDSERIVRRGEPLGFVTDATGAVVAVAGEENFELPPLPERARYCVWYFRAEEPSRLSRGTGRLLNNVGKVAEAGATGAVIAGVAWAESALDDEDERCPNVGRDRKSGHESEQRHTGKPPEGFPKVKQEGRN